MTRLHLRQTAAATLFIGLASPALAQDTFCGGVGAGGTWIGNSEGNSDISVADNYREQMALVLGGNAYVSLFTLSEPTSVRVEAEGRGSGDPIIDLLDNAGGVILSDDDSGGNAASRAETFLEAGTYCMATRSYDGGPMTAFVRIGREEHEPLTAGLSDFGGGESIGSCAEATPFGPLGASVSASVNETRFYSFEIDSPTAVTITAENEAADPVITLYDANETYIDSNDDFDGLNSRLDITNPLATGTYCLEMAALSDESLPITVTISAYSADEALGLLYARGELAPPLDGSVAITDLGVLQSRLRQDVQATADVSWFTMDIEEPSLVVFEAVGGGNSDPWLIIYDDFGRLVGQNDDYGDGLDSLVMARVQSGTYIVGVRQFNSGQGLIRLLAERYVRAN
ncbi:PPC domain-containing protein [Yoonia sp.]|uniref:PPC domain-containing protein n=1 Tax=Yoonia sp. TaxID=2212373 RepID=UPI002FD8A5FA